jgi:hypothetical protein
LTTAQQIEAMVNRALEQESSVRHLMLVESPAPVESVVARSMVDEFIDLP